MRWTQVVGVALVIGAVGSTPLAAQASATETVVPSVESSWPVIVPRLTTYTEAQKVSITAAVKHYCFENAWPSRAELQARIRAVLTPEQVLAAVQYWIPQDVQGDLRAMGRELMTDTSFAQSPSAQPVVTVTLPAAPAVDACGRERPSA